MWVAQSGEMLFSKSVDCCCVIALRKVDHCIISEMLEHFKNLVLTFDRRNLSTSSSHFRAKALRNIQ